MARDELRSNLTKGAVGLAITAGALAAGMLMADEDMRGRWGRKAKTTGRKLKKSAKLLAESYPEYKQQFRATAHSLRLNKSKGRSTGAMHQATRGKAKRGRPKKRA